MGVYNIALIILALLGITNAGYLYWQYQKKVKEQRPMFCPFGQQCETVVGSKWGKTLGIKNEIMGIIFYSLLIALNLWQLIGSDFSKINEFIFFLALIAALASTYLIIVQFKVLKSYCSWCIFATIINYLIFLTSVFLINY